MHYWILSVMMVGFAAQWAGCSNEKIYNWDTGSMDGTVSDTDTDPFVEIVDNSYIWIANTGEGTVSKVDTRLEVEVARYITSPYGQVRKGDPSRTTVNRHGDAVVLNRVHPVSVSADGASATKFAVNIEECVEKNGIDGIQTSTGPSDVPPWDQDECMLWHTSLGVGVVGARAAAWDGNESSVTGVGGNVWVGTCKKLERPFNAKDFIFKLNGDTGEILEKIPFSGCAYGAAMDRNGGLWIVDRNAKYSVHRLDTKTLNIETVRTNSGYGITLDSKGRVWATGGGGVNRVSRYTYGEATAETLTIDRTYSFPRGTGLGVNISAGYIWVADSPGNLLKFDETTFALVGAYPLNFGATIGIGIDIDGFVWIVSESANAAFKFDPVSETFTTVPVGTRPYTYSDMTGVQLRVQFPEI